MALYIMHTIKIDFVSDIACPWCAVGLGALEQAIANVRDQIRVELHFQPFELNPQMPAEGQDISEHLTQKYGSTPEQQTQIRDMIRQRGAEVHVWGTRPSAAMFLACPFANSCEAKSASIALRAAGDDEASGVDEDYLRAMGERPAVRKVNDDRKADTQRMLAAQRAK